ncbi:MAG: hypothetical protein E3J72_12550 [Planctomycetota bacterium]|nr:MAG: hypothetical protein E3J72_12550 [Planctomycetota bacterium]
MTFMLNLAVAEDGGILKHLISPLLLHALIWALFTIWAGLVLFLPSRRKPEPEPEDEFDDNRDILAQYEGTGAKAAGIVLYLAAISIVLLAGTYYEVPALIASGVLCSAGLLIAYLVKVQVKASRVALGAGVMGAILGGLIIAQYTIRNVWKEPETLAANIIKQLQEAEDRFYNRYGEVGSIKELQKNSIARGPKLEKNRKHGYVFTVEPDLRLRWILTARPDSLVPRVLAHYYADGTSGKIRHARGRPARVTSPIWTPPKKE